MRLLKFLLIIPLVLGAVALAVYLVPLPGAMAEPWSDQRHQVAAVATGVAGAVCLAWLILDLRKLTWSRAKVLEPLLVARGFTLKTNYGFARHYHGQSGGYPTIMVLRPAYRLEPWRIELSIDGGPGLELAMGNKKPLQIASGYKLLTITEPGFTPLVMLARDENRARQYLSRLAVQSALKLLIENLALTTGWELYLEPQQIRAFFRTYKPDPTTLGAWLDTLPKLVDDDKQE